METTIDDNPLKQELRKLRKAQISGTYNGEPWDKNVHGARLNELLKQLSSPPPTPPTENHRAALRRQITAGSGGTPSLTPEESRLIIEANSSFTSKKKG